MGALNNPEVGKYVNEFFVSSYQKVATFKIVNGNKQGGNVAAYFCAPDGPVLHCVAGPVDAATFLREAKWTVETAKVCYGNYGVTFNMTAVQHVTGDEAIPLFRELREQSGQEPRWNFFKYVVDRQGRVVGQFSSKTTPDDPALQAAVEKAIASQ